MTCPSNETAADIRRMKLFAALQGCHFTPPRRAKTPRPLSSLKQPSETDHSAEWRSCLRKTGFDSQRAAERFAEKAYVERGVRLRVYFCEHCRKYHLTKRMHEYPLPKGVEPK